MMPLASTRRLTSISVTIWLSCWVIEVRAFQLWQRPIPTGPFGCNPGGIKRNNGIRFSKGTDSSTLLEERAPIAFASGHSSNVNLLDAIQEATTEAIKALPPPMEIEQQQPKRRVDLALVAVSSLYDGGSQPPATTVVPSVLAAAARTDGVVIDHLIGSSVAGCISSTVSLDPRTTGACQPVEYERLPAVSVTLCQIPATQFTTFHVSDVPNDPGRLPPTEWKRAVGLSSTIESSDQDEPWSFLLIPVPSFSTKVDDLLFGLNVYFPQCVTVGGIASTVSSLSRAKLYHYSRHLHDSSSCCYTEGCVGVAWRGDLEVQTLTAQGVKPVGGVYRILKGTDSTISAIVLDEDATAALDDRGNDDEEADDDDDDDDVDNNDESIPPSSKPDARAAAAQAYAKARIPKPVLAEANFLMRTLSDDEQAFMRRALLVGLEQQQQNTGGMTARTASELARLASGQGGYRFKVQQVASAGMKDGSVTFPLGSVQVTPGLRMRFFVRESNFARKEVETLWVAYKKALLNRQFNVVESSKLQSSSDGLTFQPAACWLIPTMDRGNKFFLGNKAGYESTTAARMMPTVPSISGFFSNGVIVTGQTVQGSASGYFLFGSRSGRPVYSPQVDTSTRDTPIKSEQSSRRPSRAVTALEDRAPRNEYGELILRRREVHAGRALTVSTVEWSVAEKSAQPTSALEGFMWDKETEVDRYRERVPLANLVSQCKLAQTDPRSPKPRDFVAALKMTSQDFVIIPEIKQTDPATGSLHRRFDVKRQTRNFTTAKAAALCVNCDSIFFGGSLEDIKTVRDESALAAVEQMESDGVVVPPILALDLILYPYQLYKLRLAGADAVNLVAGALAAKDLVYLTKIAASLQLQVMFTVTSEYQIQAIAVLPAGSFSGVIISNRVLEDYSFDATGEQALHLLRSEAMANLRARHGNDIPVLVQGRVGLIEHLDGNNSDYIRKIKDAGATGAVVGGALAVGDALSALQSLYQAITII